MADTMSPNNVNSVRLQAGHYNITRHIPESTWHRYSTILLLEYQEDYQLMEGHWDQEGGLGTFFWRE